MSASVEMDGTGHVVSLPQLQNLMKRDPEAYLPEFEQQWSHFKSMMEMFKLKPQKPSQSFGEQVMFLAHVAPSFGEKGSALPEVLISALNEHFEVMHPSMRQVLVQALILLRNRNQFPCIRTLPTYFKLFGLQDKNLRKMVFSHIVRDMVKLNNKNSNQKLHAELRDFFFAKLKEGEAEVARRACAVFISMYRQNVWRDARVVNLMSAGLLHPDVKLVAALAHLFLGNRTKGLEGILDESDGSGDEDVQEAVRGIVGAKKTANREKRLERAKKAAKKAADKKKKKAGAKPAAGVSFVAIDLLHDPQTLADRLLQRLSKSGEPFLFRLLLLHLTTRLVSRHELQLPNLYPFLLKYLNPGQHEVTKVLAALVEACHPLVPPDELRPVVLHVMNSFVTEAQAAEVIEVGLNAIREVCSRAVNILTEDELADLVGFRTFKNKGVRMAARSLINTYRELHPQLLHRSLRGRQASMALSRGEVQTPLYGDQHVLDRIDGLDLLVGKRKASDGPEAADAAKQLMVGEVLGSEDFKQLRKLRLQKSIEMQLGKKRKADELSSSSSESEDSDDEPSDGERGLPGRMPDAMSAEELKATAPRARTKAQRLAKVKAGRTNYKEKLLEDRKKRRGGQTNQEKLRHKPLLMAMHSQKVQKKKALTAKQKVRGLKKHIGTLRKNINHQKRRR